MGPSGDASPLGGAWHLLCGSWPEGGFGTTQADIAFTCSPVLTYRWGISPSQATGILLPLCQVFPVCCRGRNQGVLLFVPNISCWAITPAFSLARRRKYSLNMIFPLRLSLSFLRLLEQPATGVVLGMLLEGMEWKIMGVYWMAWA